MRKQEEQINKRIITLRHSDSPLTSKRVRIILSNPADSLKLAKAVRNSRHHGAASFEVTDKTANKIKLAKEKLQKAQ